MSTYTPIASITLGSAQTSVTFSNIPQTYTDLIAVITTKDSGTGANWTALQFNSDTGSNYSWTQLGGNGSTASSTRGTGTTNLRVGAISTTSFTPAIIHIMNYANTTTNKTAISRNSLADYPTSGSASAFVGLWRNTSAITSINISVGGQDFASGSTFNLYGIANASITNTAKATGGDSVTTDGTYWYHTFRSSGTFTPTQALTADYLVVAGGGGAGKDYSGGGGAGGLRSTVTATGGGGSLESAISLTAQNYTVTVGAGGAGGTTSGAQGNKGSNSVFATITSEGGGYGAKGDSDGGAGGSGGGSAWPNGSNTRTGGAGTTGQGYKGGDSFRQAGTLYQLSGGGGGAGAAGGNATSGSASGAGGNGVAVSISGSSVTYAGGGGGGGYVGYSITAGAGGTGGGGAGKAADGVAGDNGTANTGGGGGGGAGNQGNGGSGGSGIVIIRYAV